MSIHILLLSTERPRRDWRACVRTYSSAMVENAALTCEGVV
jgi:hypothetical protein